MRILIGATAIELGDRYAVPRYGVVPGVMVQALAAESLLQDRPVQRSSSLVTLLGILLISLSLLPRPVDRPLRYLGVFAAVLLTIAAAPIVAQSLWPVSVDSAAWLFTALASVTAQAAIEAKRRLRLRAHLDADSGLPNRAVLELALAGNTADETVLVATGIERFETIRDSIGLAATNEAIRGAAEMIGRTVQGPIYRIAPDVLAWTQPEADGVPAALRRLATIFRTPVQTAAGPVDLAFTSGLDAGHGKAPVLRIERALSAIGTARAAGKPHSWYEDSPATPTRQLSMMSDLRQAMEKGRLRLAYQPKMNLATGTITDAEALIRWYDESGRTISPDEFIPLAEATGVIREVTTFALQTAALELSSWARSGVAVRVAVNVSALDLATPDFLETVDHALAAANVPPFQLTLEVTESALIRSPEKAIATLTALRDRGIRLAVDDYGTGQSTLTYVKRLPIHELKIDKSFVTTLPTSESDQIMVRSTINLAHDLGLQVVAEGIEDEATLDLLTEMGCDYAQGYFISKPISPNEFLELVSSPRRIAACR
jgi:EAL domain-containing protein (putative c-di-GMP-specific phosphodiesterase class I)/GGDEF domain-containing protein